MCILFDKCNLNCSFCFESNKTKTINSQYINNLPHMFTKCVEERHDVDCLEITMMGGEVFMDTLNDDIFETYKNVCTTTYQLISDIRPNIDVNFNWLSNGVFKKKQRVEQLLVETKSTISFSYDSVGRYPSNVQLNMMKENVKKFSEAGLLEAILITPTVKSINKFVQQQDDIPFLAQYTNKLDLSYYIPGQNWQSMYPSNNQLFQFFKSILDRRLFQFKDICELLKPFVFDPGQYVVYPTCNCDDLVTITEAGSTNICVKINSCLPLERFYGKRANKVTEQTVKFYRKPIGLAKRGCAQCRHYEYCVKPCWTAVIFDGYVVDQCPFDQTYNYINSNPSIIDDYLKFVQS